jgi:hypothetical protein
MCLDGAWEILKDIANSNFVTALIGSAAGAWFGAWAAQRIAEKAKVREEIKTTLERVNIGISMAAEILDNLGGFKKQLVRPLKTSYDEAKARMSAPVKNPQDEVKMDFTYLPPKTLPTVALRDLVFSIVGLPSRPMSAVSGLVQVFDQLNLVIEYRNKLIAQYKDGELPSGATLKDLYFGLPYKNSLGVDTENHEYGETLNGIAAQLDDAISFCVYLSQDIHCYGNKIRDKEKKLFKNMPLTLREVDTSKLVELNLIPPTDNRWRQWLLSFKDASVSCKE